MKININIPSDLSEIKLKDYQKYMEMVEKEPDATEFLNIKLVEIFCHLKINDINAIKVNDYEDILRELIKTFESNVKFKKMFTHKGIKYGFIPDLENITMGEYIDLNNYLGEVSTYHKAMAVMFRPIIFEKKELYLIEKYETSAKYEGVMSEVGMDIFKGANVFFYNLGKQLVKSTIASLGEEKACQLEKTLQENGVGIHQFMHLLEGSSLNWMRSPIGDLESA